MQDGPTLLARKREIYELREDALAAAIDARLRAARLTAAHLVLTRQLLRRPLRGEDPENIHRALGVAAQRAFTGGSAP